MGHVSLNSNQISDVTVVSNTFIDYYMPAANGSYVKVYLYLLRCLYVSDFNISISIIADSLEDSEKDIVRALKYWEKVQVITLKQSGSGDITGIHLNDLKPPDEKDITVSHSNSVLSENPLHYAANETHDINLAAEESAAASEDMKGHKVHINTGIDKPTYTEAQINELKSYDEVKWMLSIIEKYLGRYLKPTDLQLILYLYESVGFSAELILHLYDYCISKNKTSIKYIDAVALSWANQGIRTVEEAESAAEEYDTNYNAVKNTFGLNRGLANKERQYIDKWVKSYGFDTAIITEACNRTIMRTQKPDFKYTDSILDSWNKNKVRHLSDVTELDKAHQKTAQKTTAPPQLKANPNNRFNAFPQRDYSKEDMSALEQKLLRNR